jgi:hypothetical protein
MGGFMCGTFQIFLAAHTGLNARQQAAALYGDTLFANAAVGGAVCCRLAGKTCAAFLLLQSVLTHVRLAITGAIV